MAAEHLQAGAGAVEGLVGQRGLEHGRDQRAPALGGCALGRTAMVARHIELQGRVVGQQAAAVDPGALRVQDAAHGRVFGNRVGAGRCRRAQGLGCAHLAALARIGVGLLPGGFEQAQALQAHMQAGGVHHHEHGGQALVGLAHQPAGGIVEAHHAGGAAVQAHLFLDALAGHGIAFAAGKPLGNEEQRQALGARRRIGQARQHQVHDVVGEVVLAAGDEDLAAVDAHAAIGLRHAARAHQAQVAAGVGLGQAHGGQPFAAGDLAKVLRLERIAAMVAQAFVGAVQQAGGHGPAVVGAGQPFEQHAFEHGGQALAAILGRAGQRGPAGLPEGLVGGAKAGGGGHLPAVEVAAFFITAALQRGNSAVHEARGLIEHLQGQIGIRVGKRCQRLPLDRRLQHLAQQVGDVA